MEIAEDFEMDCDLVNRLSTLLKEALESEREKIVGNTRRSELRRLIERYEVAFSSDDGVEALFIAHVDALPEERRPAGRVQEIRMFGEWEANIRSEFAAWKRELDEIVNRPADTNLIFNSVLQKVVHLLRKEASAAGFAVDEQQISLGMARNSLIPLSELRPDRRNRPAPPTRLHFPDRKTVTIRNWKSILSEIGAWLIDTRSVSQDILSEGRINSSQHLMINSMFRGMEYSRSQRQYRLSTAQTLEIWLSEFSNGSEKVCHNSRELLMAFGEDPGEFYLELRIP